MSSLASLSVAAAAVAVAATPGAGTGQWDVVVGVGDAAEEG